MMLMSWCEHTRQGLYVLCVHVCVWLCVCGPCLLVQHRSDYCAPSGVSLKHQCVQVGQEGVADVQDVPGRIGKGGIPRYRILSLIGEIEMNSNYKDS